MKKIILFLIPFLFHCTHAMKRKDTEKTIVPVAKQDKQPLSKKLKTPKTTTSCTQVPTFIETNTRNLFEDLSDDMLRVILIHKDYQYSWDNLINTIQKRK